MNYICPLCNSLKEVQVACEYCNEQMDDCGKVVDYFDQYSAYESIATLKLVDGNNDSLSNDTCLHLFFCSTCLFEKTVAVKEERLT